jgi:aminopeptidase N
VNEYLEKFKFKNTVSEDLWDALTTASKKPVKEMMEMWTKETGYPVIKVTFKVKLYFGTIQMNYHKLQQLVFDLLISARS